MGTRVPRVDIPAKASGKYIYMQHVRVPGMLHGRVVRHRGRGAYYHDARVISVDESSIADIPGARVVRRKDFVGVVAPDEWSAVKAAERLRVTWDMPAMLPSSPEELFERLRSAKTDDQIVVDRDGDRRTSARRHGAVIDPPQRAVTAYAEYRDLAAAGVGDQEKAPIARRLERAL